MERWLRLALPLLAALSMATLATAGASAADGPAQRGGNASTVTPPATAAAVKRTPAKLCKGAAARAPGRHCVLDQRTITPLPDDAIITPNVSCEPPSTDTNLERCSYGTPANKAVATVALIGDSHAAHWRAAVQAVALARHWRVIEFARPLCFFTSGTPDQDYANLCVALNQQILDWLTAHPEVRTVFLSGNSFADVVAAAGADRAVADRAASLAELQALPPSVTSAVVIRDNPQNEVGTDACLDAALHKHQRTEHVCAVPRSYALREDYLVTAARELKPARAHVVDFTRFFCSATKCYPVVGGVLTHKDQGHLTQDFVKTLAPYLLARVATYVPAPATLLPGGPSLVVSPVGQTLAAG